MGRLSGEWDLAAGLHGGPHLGPWAPFSPQTLSHLPAALSTAPRRFAAIAHRVATREVLRSAVRAGRVACVAGLGLSSGCTWSPFSAQTLSHLPAALPPRLGISLSTHIA